MQLSFISEHGIYKQFLYRDSYRRNAETERTMSTSYLKIKRKLITKLLGIFLGEH